MILSDIENYVRQDLFDPLGGGSQRWLTSDIDRGVDRAVDRYSAYYPNIAQVDMQMQPFQRTYPYPNSFNNSKFPVLWLERVLYPLQVYGSQFTPPTSGPTAAAQSGTWLGIGQYGYAVSFLSQGGETPPSPIATVNTTSGNQKVALLNIPVANGQPAIPGIATNTVIGRNLYRTLVGSGALLYLATIPDNSTTTYVDNASDTSLAAMPSPPTINTSGVMLWPPIERAFNEYSNLFDSTAALAAGGNMGINGAIGPSAGPTGTAEPSFTLQLSSAELPKDNSLCMRVFYATKHQLDSNGSTIPEIHRDIICLGAVAYCMEAYSVPTNDNFDFQDGGLRDRVDDTKIPGAWAAAVAKKLAQFEARLREVKQQRDFASSARVHWGDVGKMSWRL